MYIRKHTLFSTMHPVVLLAYTWGALVFAMLLKHPLFVGTSFIIAVLCNGFYYGARSTGKAFLAILPVMMLIAGVNVLTNHRGMEILFQIGHTPYTEESFAFGMISALMLGAVMLWFRCYTAIVSNEKFLYLFGKKFPTTALLLSMIMKLFPETGYKIRCIQNAQKDIGEEKKLKKAMRQISCLLEWSMEDAIETADSMKARGYETCRRTSYEQYRYSAFDYGMLAVYAGIFLLMVIGIMDGTTEFQYFPTFSANELPGERQRITGSLYAAFLLSPMLVELWDGINQMVRNRRKDARYECNNGR